MLGFFNSRRPIAKSVLVQDSAKFVHLLKLYSLVKIRRQAMLKLSLLGMITVKLQEDNFVKWNYQFQSVLQGYDLFYFFNGESQCPPKFVINFDTGVTKEITTAYKEWIKTYVSLLSLLIATLSDDAMDYVIGCTNSHEAWKCIQERCICFSCSN